MKLWLQETIPVKELLKRHPNLLQTFTEMKLLCAGCPADAFHTLADVAKEYGLDQRAFLADLQNAIEAAAGHQQGGADANP